MRIWQLSLYGIAAAGISTAAAADIPAAARSSVAVMTAAGLMQTENGAFHPNAELTTEQAITVLVSLVENPAPRDLSASAEAKALPLGLEKTAVRAASNLI